MNNTDLFKACKQWVEETDIAGMGFKRRRSEGDFINPEGAIKYIVIKEFTKKINRASLKNRIRLALDLLLGRFK